MELELPAPGTKLSNGHIAKPWAQGFRNPDLPCARCGTNPRIGGSVVYCVQCKRLITKDAELRHRFGISLAEYTKLLATQKGVCAICESPDTATATRKYLCVDHDHTTGKIRGLLCNACNKGIGMFKDTPALLIKAADYVS